MRTFLLLCLMCIAVFQIASAQPKTWPKAEIKKPTKVETLEVRPSAKWQKPIPKKTAPRDVSKKTGLTIPAGMRLEKAKIAIVPTNAKRSYEPTPVLQVYRPQKPGTIKGIRTLAVCDTITLSRQSQIDSFPIYYPGCTAVKILTIEGRGASPAITSLDSLRQITEITQDLNIFRTAIPNLSGINNITKVGSYFWLDSNYAMTSTSMTNLEQLGGLVFYNSPLMTNMNGLFDKLTSTNLWSVLFGYLGVSDFTAFSRIQSVINLSVAGCPNITSLNGFHNLASADFGLQLFDNQQLTDLSMLDQITRTNYLDIYTHPNLTSLNGLQNITSIPGIITLISNDNLAGLQELNSNLVVENVQSTADKIRILYNPKLALCAVPFLCKYLSTGAAVEITGNATGCGTVAEVTSACPAGCAVEDSVTWNGSQNNSWNVSLNWTPNKIPEGCTKVFIPAGTPNEPALYNDVSIGGLVMDGSTLYQEGYSMTVTKTLRLNNAGVYNGNSFVANKVVNPLVQYSYLDGTFSCTDYSGKAEFISNSFAGDVTLSDSTGRNDVSMAYFNTYQRNFTLINNSEYGQNYVSNASPFYDYVTGDLTIVNNSSADIAIGIADGRPLKVQGNLILNASSGRIDIYNLTYVGGTFNPSTRQLGSNPVIINNLYMESGAETRLEQPVEITNSLVFDIGSNKINTTASNLLVLGQDATVTRDAANSRGFVNGPLKKRGNQAFTFPVGKYEFSLGGDKYAPISISAPANAMDEFTAEHFRSNPNVDGFDTASYTPGFGGISGKEYWQLTRNAGTSNVLVTLSYDSSRSGVSFDLSKTQVASWNGSRWTSLGNGGSTGNIAQGSVQSVLPVTNYGPITFSLKPIRKPVITMLPIDTFACIGVSFMVRFSLDTAMVAGNLFRVQLSDTLGNFNTTSPIIGSKFTTTSDSFFVTLPGTAIVGKQYQLRLVGTLPPDTSINTVTVKVNTLPQQAFTLVGPTDVCMGTGPAKYYPSIKENGVTYTLTLEGGGGTITKIGDTSFVTFTNPSAANTLTMRTSNNCGNGSPIAQLQVRVKPAAPTIAPIISNIGRKIIAPASALAQNVNSIRWYKNGVLIAGANDYTYYASAGGNYTASYANDCGETPPSNVINFIAASLPNTITFNAIPNKVFTDAPFALNATSSSGLPVETVLQNGPGNLTAGVYTITSTGTASIVATQPGDNIYDTAATVVRTFDITKSTQTILFATLPNISFGLAPFTVAATSTSGLPVSYTVNSGPAVVSGNVVTITGLGTVSITASQLGSANYLPALPVTQTFCVSVPKLSGITGVPYVCPGQSAAYQVNHVPGLTYSWRIANGATLSSSTNTINVTWPTAGTYTLIVSASGPCGSVSANDSFVVNVVNAITPGAVSNMLPANGITDQQLPLTLSWLPGSNALNYDVYVWDSATTQPATPFAANISGVLYNIPASSLAYNKTYNWRIVSKNACLQTNGPIQRFRLRKVADLMVTEVLAPTAANSGQTIAISWKVKNIGPGNTNTNQHWTDAVFLSFDTIPNFDIPPNTSNAAWNQLEFPVRPLLVGTKPNVSALDSGQQYSNSINFTVPVNYGQPLYAYVISNYPAATNGPLQMTNSNDTGRAINVINIIKSPTPDLRVDTVFTTGSTFSGSTIPVTYKVKNYGVLTPPNTFWQDKLYISPSPIFNSNNAIALKRPNSLNNYYPNVTDATAGYNKQLKADSTYSNSVDVVIPNFISGAYFIHVFTNANETLYEGAAANNNINHNVIQVFLTPTPQLTVNSLTVPFTTASITQSIGINWNVFNAGFNDNIEKNKGHYYVRSGNCAVSNLLNLNYVDSLGHGGSYWGDKVYLSTDGTGLNINNAILLGTFSSGIPFSGLSSPDILQAAQCVATAPSPLLNINITNVLRPASNHPGSLAVALPSHLAQGNYYVYVYANQEKTVFEFPDTPSIRRSALPITVLRPDLVVNNVTVPATASGAQPISISYSIQNNGPGAVFNANRNDRIYVSSSPTFTAAAVLIGTYTFNATIPLNTPVSNTITYTFPPGTSGTRYIFIQTNSDSLFAENNYNNNMSAAASINVTAAAPADLRITQLQFPDSVFALRNNFIKYRIENNGTAAANGEWKDSIFISCEPVFDRAKSYFVTLRNQTRRLAAGSSVTDSFNLSIQNFGFQFNSCFPKTNTNQAYFYIITNSNNSIYEGVNTSNNVTASGSQLLVNTYPDLIVTNIQAGDTATVARKYRVNYTVKNIGYAFSKINAYWNDGIYFSPDSVFNNKAVLATNFGANSKLEKNGSYSESFDADAPNLPAGDYYVMMYTNSTGALFEEFEQSNNIQLIRNASGAAKKIHVIQPLLADFTDSIIAVPTVAAVGQPITLVHQITNKGAGVNYPTTFSNTVWLSTDFIPGNTGDIRLSAVNKTIALAPGAFYIDSITALIPISLPEGNYVLISHADASNNIFEPVDSNNIAYSYITVYRPAPADLIVQHISIPDSVYLGYTLDTAKWTIANISANNATGISADGIYLSKSSVLDSTAVLLGVKNKTLNMAPLSTETIQLHPLVNDVTEGLYNVMVKTDLLNNIIESNKTNNTVSAVGKLYVKVKPLTLNTTETNTLHTVQRYYKLRIPDSLRGSTIQVTLKTNDSLTMRNEMYIGAGYVPTAAKFNYRFETPNAGNQQIIISDVSDSSYYILVRSASPNPVVQNISLKAVKLPFAILQVQSNTGGNGGNATVKISGSLFTKNMQAKLTKPGTTITASAMYFINSTTVFATFPLQGKPLGVYDVSLTKTDASVTTLAGSYSVVSPNNGGLNTGGGVNTGPTNNGSEPGCDPGADGGLNAQLVTELVHPEKVFAGWPFTVQVNYSNPTNMDVPAQIRILYNNKNVPMALSQAGLAAASASLVLTLTEPGGPPGFIRAGGSGSIIIYAKAPVSTPGHTIVTFNLK